MSEPFHIIDIMASKPEPREIQRENNPPVQPTHDWAKINPKEVELRMRLEKWKLEKQQRLAISTKDISNTKKEQRKVLGEVIPMDSAQNVRNSLEARAQAPSRLSSASLNHNNNKTVVVVTKKPIRSTSYAGASKLVYMALYQANAKLAAERAIKWEMKKTRQQTVKQTENQAIQTESAQISSQTQTRESSFLPTSPVSNSPLNSKIAASQMEIQRLNLQVERQKELLTSVKEQNGRLQMTVIKYENERKTMQADIDEMCTRLNKALCQKSKAYELQSKLKEIQKANRKAARQQQRDTAEAYDKAIKVLASKCARTTASLLKYQKTRLEADYSTELQNLHQEAETFVMQMKQDYESLLESKNRQVRDLTRPSSMHHGKKKDNVAGHDAERQSQSVPNVHQVQLAPKDKTEKLVPQTPERVEAPVANSTNHHEQDFEDALLQASHNDDIAMMVIDGDDDDDLLPLA